MLQRILPVLAALGLAAGPAVAAPAAAPGPVAVALPFVLGMIAATAAVLVLCWQGLRDRIAPRSDWLPFAVLAAAVVPLGLVLGDLAPLPALLMATATAAWGAALLWSLCRRLGALLQDRDHAHAEVRRARQDSERDPLTGVLNRGALRQRLEQQAADSQGTRPLSLLYFDLDLFKLINDSLGHGVGDACLKAVASTVAGELRGGDVLGRLGGEEFAVVLPGARRIHAVAVGERIRTAVQEHCRTVGEEVVELTVSIGVAEYLGADEPIDALMERADRAMYNAKGSGRNMVVADPATPPGA